MKYEKSEFKQKYKAAAGKTRLPHLPHEKIACDHVAFRRRARSFRRGDYSFRVSAFEIGLTVVLRVPTIPLSHRRMPVCHRSCGGGAD